MVGRVGVRQVRVGKWCHGRCDGREGGCDGR